MPAVNDKLKLNSHSGKQEEEKILDLTREQQEEEKILDLTREQQEED